MESAMTKSSAPNCEENSSMVRLRKGDVPGHSHITILTFIITIVGAFRKPDNVSANHRRYAPFILLALKPYPHLLHIVALLTRYAAFAKSMWRHSGNPAL